MVSSLNKEKIIELLKNKKLLYASWGCEVDDNFEKMAWIPILKKIFVQIDIFSTRNYYFANGREKLNEKFLKTAVEKKPDYIFMGLNYDEFKIETFFRLKELLPETKLIMMFGDDPWRYEDWSRYYAIFCDYILTSEKDNPYSREDGLEPKRVSTFIGVDCNLYRPLNLPKKYDVNFFGGPIRDRYDYIKFLIDNGIDVKIFGSPSWKEYPDICSSYLGWLDSKDHINLINETKINLSFSKTGLPEKGERDTHFKGRVFDISASRAFPLIEKFFEYNKYFKTKSIDKVLFKNKEELLEKVRYYLKNDKEREKIAEKIYNEVLKRYTWEDAFFTLFSKALKYNLPMAKIPIINRKYLTLKKEDLMLEYDELNEKLKGIDYVTFKTNNLESEKYREYIQMYSLEKSKKDISCCDYYVYSWLVGDYVLFKAKTSFKQTQKKSFDKFIQLNQLMVKRKYFLENLADFKKFFDSKDIDIINDENTVFVSIPLIRARKIRYLDYSSLKVSTRMKFLDDIYINFHSKNFLYMFKVLLLSISGKFFMFKFIKDSFIKPENWFKLKTFKK